jgi:NTP pyrophosphatase (non-canonical NTP hydrolase)
MEIFKMFALLVKRKKGFSMNEQFYREAVAKLINPKLNFEQRLGNFALGLVCEAGEIGDLIKKILYHNHPMTEELRTKLEKELGDVRFYYTALLTLLDFEDKHIKQGNIDKLSKRYPNLEFSTERSLNRLDLK